jgi:hypothetical protein
LTDFGLKLRETYTVSRCASDGDGQRPRNFTFLLFCVTCLYIYIYIYIHNIYNINNYAIYRQIYPLQDRVFCACVCEPGRTQDGGQVSVRREVFTILHHCCCVGILLCWYIVVLLYWYIGILLYWCIGIYCCIVVLVYCYCITIFYCHVVTVLLLQYC